MSQTTLSDPVSVTLDREEWQALLNAVPVGAMSWTPTGLLVTGAYQAIEHTLDPDKPDQVAT